MIECSIGGGTDRLMPKISMMSFVSSWLSSCRTSSREVSPLISKSAWFHRCCRVVRNCSDSATKALSSVSCSDAKRKIPSTTTPIMRLTKAKLVSDIIATKYTAHSALLSIAASAISIQPSKVTMQKCENSALPNVPKYCCTKSSSGYCWPSKTIVKMDPVYVMIPSKMHIQSTADTDSCSVLTRSTKSRNIRRTRTKRTRRTSRRSRSTVKELMGLSSPPMPDNGVSTQASRHPVTVTTTSKVPHASKKFLIRGSSARIRRMISTRNTHKKQDSTAQKGHFSASS
mmetsp:Transcript_67343/g.161465  ORF Transcript_67343/g.161465 Transcript_67343/m.161465 type:complete len:286 (-) Transcript_67343:537-1394(-)